MIALRGLLGCCALLVVGFNLGGYKTLNSHEVFAAVPARNMLGGGSWVVPDLGGTPRLEKPPLVYWEVAIFGWLTGKVDELSTRVPQFLAGIALAVLVGVWAAKNYGSDVGWTTGFVQLTALGSVVYSRQGVVEMTLILLTTSALLLVVSQPREQSWRDGFVRWSCIFGLLGISMLGKFHYGPAMVLGPCFVWWAVDRRWREFRHLLNPLGWALMLGPLCWWMVAVSSQLPEATNIWWTETVGRATGAFSSTPMINFLPAPLYLALPWSLFLLFELPRSWEIVKSKADDRERFLWCWLGAQAAIILIQPNRHISYFLATLPACSILAGRQLAGLLRRREWLRFQWTRSYAVSLSLTAIAISLGFAWAIPKWRPELKSSAIAVASLVAAGSTISVLCNQRRQFRTAYAVFGASTFLVALIAIGSILPEWDSRKGTAEFCQRVRHVMPHGTIISFQDRHSPLHYLQHDAVVLDHTDQLLRQLQVQGTLLVLGREESLHELETIGEVTRIESMTSRECRGLYDEEMLSLWEIRPKSAYENSPDDPIRRERIVLDEIGSLR